MAAYQQSDPTFVFCGIFSGTGNVSAARWLKSLEHELSEYRINDIIHSSTYLDSLALINRLKTRCLLPFYVHSLFSSCFSLHLTYQPLSLSTHPCLNFSSSPELFHCYWRSDGFLLHTSTLSSFRSYRNVHRSNTFIPQSTRKYVCETSISHFDVSSHEKKGSRTNGKATDGIPKTGYGRNTVFVRYNTASLQRYICRLWASLI